MRHMYRIWLARPNSNVIWRDSIDTFFGSVHWSQPQSILWLRPEEKFVVTHTHTMLCVLVLIQHWATDYVHVTFPLSVNRHITFVSSQTILAIHLMSSSKGVSKRTVLLEIDLHFADGCTRLCPRPRSLSFCCFSASQATFCVCR